MNWIGHGRKRSRLNFNVLPRNLLGGTEESHEKPQFGESVTRPRFEPVISRIQVKRFFFILVCEAIGTAATPDLLCEPWVIVKMIVEKQMECRLAGETEVLGENLPQRHFCPSQNPT
jgi:hypothetical protein